MRAVRLYGVGDLRLEEIAEPGAPGADQVVLRVTAAGICGSDLHNFRTGAWISRAPSVAGHEFAGIVTAVGDGVWHVVPGDRVLVDSRVTCGLCAACLAGRGQVCDRLGFVGEVIDGGFAQGVMLPARNVMRAPDGVPDRHLAMAEPLAVALHALNRLAAPPGARIVVAGCGPIGAFVTLLARRAGHEVWVLDRNPHRTRMLAAEVGAEVIGPGGLAALDFRHAVDATGQDPVIRELVGAIGGCSSLALVGIGRSAPLIDPARLVEREITVLGCHAFGDELAKVAALLPDLTGQLDAFVAEVIPLTEVPQAYARHIAGDVAGIKTIIDCEGLQHG